MIVGSAVLETTSPIKPRQLQAVRLRALESPNTTSEIITNINGRRKNIRYLQNGDRNILTIKNLSDGSDNYILVHSEV